MWGALLIAMALQPSGSDRGLLLDVRWAGPPSCPPSADVRADIEGLVGAPMVEGEERVAFEASVEPLAAGMQLTVVRRDASGGAIERGRIEADDCATLAKAFALIVAVDAEPLRMGTTDDSSLDAPPSRVEPATVPPPEPLPEPAETREVPPRPPADPTKPPSSAGGERPLEPGPRWVHRGFVGIHGGVDWGSTPRPTTVLGGWVGYGLGPLRLELSGEHALRNGGPAREGASVSSQSTGGAAQLRFVPVVRTLAVSVGAGLAAGWIRGQGRGPRVIPRDARDWWLSVPLSAGLAWPADARIALRAHAEVGLGLRRPAIEVVDPSNRPVVVVRRPPATVRLIVGPRVRFP